MPTTEASKKTESKKAVSKSDKAKITNRLRRLEGQIRGLERMVEEDRSCQEVLTLLSGVRSALDSTADVILEHYLESCQLELAEGQADIKEMIRAVKLARG